ncbi:hypothetical protein SEA_WELCOMEAYANNA_29 [Gordonia phage WelcomeAyanna]|nr:hypothetical protein SEA_WELCOMEAYANNA_29 [Gordonia phage WelcomeAyanna]
MRRTRVGGAAYGGPMANRHWTEPAGENCPRCGEEMSVNVVEVNAWQGSFEKRSSAICMATPGCNASQPR